MDAGMHLGGNFELPFEPEFGRDFQIMRSSEVRIFVVYSGNVKIDGHVGAWSSSSDIASCVCRRRSVLNTGCRIPVSKKLFTTMG